MQPQCPQTQARDMAACPVFPLTPPACSNTTIKTKCCDNSGFCIEPAAAAARLTIRISKWRRRAKRKKGRDKEGKRDTKREGEKQADWRMS